jgi:DNA-binding transcriptional ArsR family regulator
MDPLSRTFAALADPTRRAILARLAGGAATVGELAEPFDMSLPAVSRHLKVLTEAGLIERSAEAQWRRCALRGEGLREVAGWIGDYRKFWEDRLGKLAALLEGAAPETTAGMPSAKRRRRPSRPVRGRPA